MDTACHLGALFPFTGVERGRSREIQTGGEFTERAWELMVDIRAFCLPKLRVAAVAAVTASLKCPGFVCKCFMTFGGMGFEAPQRQGLHSDHHHVLLPALSGGLSSPQLRWLSPCPRAGVCERVPSFYVLCLGDQVCKCGGLSVYLTRVPKGPL